MDFCKQLNSRILNMQDSEFHLSSKQVVSHVATDWSGICSRVTGNLAVQPCVTLVSGYVPQAT